jgi:hypothetical protein
MSIYESALERVRAKLGDGMRKSPADQSTQKGADILQPDSLVLQKILPDAIREEVISRCKGKSDLH